MSTNTIVVNGFSNVAWKKLNDLRAKGYVINGVSIATITPDGKTEHGAVTTGGRVLWWWPQQQAAAPVGAIQRVRKALADRKFREATDTEDLLRMAANVIAEDGSILKRVEDKQAPAQQPLTDDTRRLEWLMLTVSGAELRRIGVCYVNNCTREDIDSAILASAASHDITGSTP